MIVVISAVAGAYGAHLMRQLLSQNHYQQAWPQIILGALAGALSGPVLSMMLPAFLSLLTVLMSSLYLGTVLTHFAFGMCGGALAMFMLGFAARIKADQ